MSELVDIIDKLEVNLKQITQLYQQNKLKLKELQNEVLEYKKNILDKNEEIRVLKNNIDTLKIANSMLGSDENKRETKLKINALIREIDQCIAQLED